MGNKILFRVIDQGHEYTIYTNGQVEGFGENPIVFNYFPELEAEFYLRQNDQPKSTDVQPMVELGTSFH
jgi:hypothetical protein